jgi:hypothetical protein
VICVTLKKLVARMHINYVIVSPLEIAAKSFRFSSVLDITVFWSAATGVARLQA